MYGCNPIVFLSGFLSPFLLSFPNELVRILAVMNPAAGEERVAKVEQVPSKHRIGLVTMLFTDIVGSGHEATAGPMKSCQSSVSRLQSEAPLFT
jgi:hypothetical protein